MCPPFRLPRKHKESFLFCSFFSLKSPVVVVGHSLHQVHFGPGHAADGPVPVVPDAHVQISGVEVLEILVEGHKVLELDGDGGRLGWLVFTDWILSRPQTSLFQVLSQNISGKSSKSSNFPAASFPQRGRALGNNGPNLPSQETIYRASGRARQARLLRVRGTHFAAVNQPVTPAGCCH